MARVKNELVFNLTELHKRLGQIVQTVALSNKHYLVKKGGLPAIVQTLNQSVRMLGPEAERQGLTEEHAVEDMRQVRRQVYQELYDKSST